MISVNYLHQKMLCLFMLDEVPTQLGGYGVTLCPRLLYLQLSTMVGEYTMISCTSGGLRNRRIIWILLLVLANAELFRVNHANAPRVELTAYRFVAANGNAHGNRLQTAIIKRYIN